MIGSCSQSILLQPDESTLCIRVVSYTYTYIGPLPPTIHRGLEWPQVLNSLLVCLFVCLSACLFSANFLIFYSTVQYSIVQYSTVQYSTVQYSTVQYITVQYSFMSKVWSDWDLIVGTFFLSAAVIRSCGHKLMGWLNSERKRRTFVCPTVALILAYVKGWGLFNHCWGCLWVPQGELRNINVRMICRVISRISKRYHMLGWNVKTSIKKSMNIGPLPPTIHRGYEWPL